MDLLSLRLIIGAVGTRNYVRSLFRAQHNQDLSSGSFFNLEPSALAIEVSAILHYQKISSNYRIVEFQLLQRLMSPIGGDEDSFSRHNNIQVN